MQLIVAWPDWNTRVDRCLMFSHTAEWLDAVYLLTACPLRPDVIDRLHPKAQVVMLGSGLSGIRFRQAVRRFAHDIVEQAVASGQQTILHDLAIARLIPNPLGSQKAARQLVRGVVSFYSPTVIAARTRAWRTNRQKRLGLRQEWANWRSVLTRLPLEFYSAGVAHAVIGNNEDIRADVIRYYRRPPQRVFVMPAEIDIDYFADAGRLPDMEPPTVLFCGRLYERKGIFDLLVAAKQLQDKGVACRFLLVGDNSLEPERIARTIADYALSQVVSILPVQPRMAVRDLMRSCSVFAFPSYFEGSPRVVKEAMAAGCPVVTYDIPGTRLFDPSGEALRLIPLGDKTGLAQAVGQLLRDPDYRARLGAAGQRCMQAGFGLTAVAGQLVNLYSRLFQAA